MKLYAQHGHGSGNKIRRGLQAGLITGVLFSPRDESPGQMQNVIGQLRREFETADLFLDPQVYATVVANRPTARLGKLEEYPYFPGHRDRTQYENVANIDNDIEECLRYQSSLTLTGWVTPNVYVPGSLDSIWGSIAKNFIRRSVEIAGRFRPTLPIYATLALSIPALGQKDELDSFLEEVTLWEDRPTGFYVLVACDTTESRPEVYTREVLGYWLYLTYSLASNGYKVMVGYSDYLSPFLWVSGASAGATGWFENLQRFSLGRFDPTTKGGRQPTPRYSSAPLVNRILVDELRRAERMGISEVRSDTSYESHFRSDHTPNREEEILQHWAAINSLRSLVDPQDVSRSLDRVIQHIATAESIYAQASDAEISFDSKSDDTHLIPWKEGLEYFKRLAEL